MATGEAVMPSGGADSKEATAMATADAMVHDVTGIDAPTEKQTQEGDGTKHRRNFTLLTCSSLVLI